MKKFALIFMGILLCLALVSCNTPSGDSTDATNNTSLTDAVTDKPTERETEYHADGTKTVRKYDENDELIGETKYDAEGNPI